MSPLASPSLVSPLCVSLLSDSGESPRPTPAYVPSILPLPEGLNLSEAERRLGGRKAREKLRAVVSRVVSRTCRLGKEAARGGGFVTLSAQGLERLVGKRYAAPALRALVASGILQAQRSQKTGKHAYAVGRFAKSYRLAPELWRRLAFVPVSDPKLSTRLRKDREDSNTLSVCHDSVNTAILANLGRVGVPVSFVGMAATLAEQAGKAPLDVARWQLSAHELATGQLWFSRADAQSRAFHNLTSLPRALRSRLTLAGEPLAEVDIANAQPLFLLSLYPEGSAERRAFAQTTGRGGFYEALFEHLPRPLSASHGKAWGDTIADWKARPELREAFKESALAYCLYSDRAGAKGGAVSAHPTNQALASLFPELSGILRRRLAVRGAASTFAREMQRREAELVLGRVFPRILAELPECAPVSLHDAVLCQARFAPAVARIVEEETRAAFGVSPTVRVKALP